MVAVRFPGENLHRQAGVDVYGDDFTGTIIVYKFSITFPPNRYGPLLPVRSFSDCVTNKQIICDDYTVALSRLHCLEFNHPRTELLQTIITTLSKPQVCDGESTGNARR